MPPRIDPDALPPLDQIMQGELFHLPGKTDEAALKNSVDKDKQDLKAAQNQDVAPTGAHKKLLQQDVKSDPAPQLNHLEGADYDANNDKKLALLVDAPPLHLLPPTINMAGSMGRVWGGRYTNRRGPGNRVCASVTDGTVGADWDSYDVCGEAGTAHQERLLFPTKPVRERKNPA
ncbi:hypothetical protein B0H19DRAFT_1077993 [Mycena capillaripes]|nr:hypothetical protein B0H19DRAFT_1077993 [Mycena capillaripes]